jgi:hypothetical protein
MGAPQEDSMQRGDVGDIVNRERSAEAGEEVTLIRPSHSIVLTPTGCA